jgi:hypothetical protein
MHLFWECVYVQIFWSDFNRKYGNTIGYIDSSTVVYSSEDALVCTLTLIAKQYISECRYTNVRPNIIVYNQKVQFVRNTEFVVAKSQNNVIRYFEKWDTLTNN